MNNTYYYDKSNQELIQSSGPFITRMKNKVILWNKGEYLFYSDNLCVVVKTDFSQEFNVLGVYKNPGDYFKTSAMIIECNSHTYGILLFDYSYVADSKNGLRKSNTLPSIFEVSNHGEFKKHAIKKNSLFSACTTKDTDVESFGNMKINGLFSESFSDYLLTSNVPPRKICPGPRGYAIGGYYIKVMKVFGRPPNSYTVHNIYGNETDELFTQLFIPRV